ncbi:MAG TPA: antitoxin Xre-like helix-turn-helix domain-containing protein [Geminicoccaceae bacterium]|nr:antitoxin Xre-like helix-turn-helix domain-containing protein [Geminicoccaceae bacterium]
MHLALLARDDVPRTADRPDAASVSRRALELFASAAGRWDLTLEQQARLLNSSLSTLQRLRRSLGGGERDFPTFDPDRLLRLSLVANIDRDLRLSLAEDGDLAWLRARNARLDGRAPLDVMVEDELPGLARVYLDVRDWTLGR